MTQEVRAMPQTHKPGHVLSTDAAYHEPEPPALATTLALIQEHLARQDLDLQAIKAAVVGDGQTGLMSRVTQLERSEKARLWVFRTVVAAVIVEAVGGFGVAFLWLAGHVKG
jgi:hypothetical protein